MPAGRPSLYDIKYCDEIIEYFDVEPYRDVDVTITKGDATITKTERLPNDLPTLAKFASKINVDRDTLHQWTKDHSEFSDAYKKAKLIQEHHLITNGLNGLYQGAFAIFTAKNVIGWKDRQETEISGPNGGPIQTETTERPKLSKEEWLLAHGIKINESN